MYIRRFLLSKIEKNTIIIDKDEFYHLKKVLRFKVNDRVDVIDGKGSLYSCEIREIKNDFARLNILNHKYEDEYPVKIIIAPSIIKSKSMNIMIEKLSEIGVDEIRPIIYDRTDVKYKEGTINKWKKLALQSLKTNGRLWPTKIYEPMKLKNLLKEFSQRKDLTKVILDIDAPLKMSINSMTKPVIVLIGPPGDFTEDEKKLIYDSNYKGFTINNWILKVETAAISIGAILKNA